MKKTSIKNITAIIDGKKIQAREGLSILEAARQANIYIPALCYLENLKAYGGCRLCIVEVKNMKGYPTACTTPIGQGMEIHTKTPELQALRSEILELTLSEHPYTCLVCKDKGDCADFMQTTKKVSAITGCNFCTSNGDCELQDLTDYLNLKEIKYPIYYRGIPSEKNNPFYDCDYNLCVLCGRCVRICNEERNSQVLAFVQRGNNTIVGTAFNESQKDAGCEFCGACVDVCPTGSISEKMGKWAGLPDKSTETTCTLCSIGCTLNINTRGNRVINIGPKPGTRSSPQQICIRGKFIPPDINHHPSRINTPLIRKKDKWVEVTWEQAIEFTASNLEKYRGNQFGMMCSAQDTVEDLYTLQKFSRKVMKSNNVDLFSSYDNRKILSQLNSFQATHPPPGLDDILKADTLLVIGTDASISHPLVENRIRKAFVQDKQVIYANAFHTRTSGFATREIIYSAGEEQNFLYQLLSELIDKTGPVLKDNILKGFKRTDPRKASKLSGVTIADVSEAVSLLDRSRNLLIIADDSIIRNTSGIDCLNILNNILNIKKLKYRCRMMFLSYEGNLLSGAFAGAHPDLLPGFENLADERMINKWNKNWQTRLSSIQGLDCNEMISHIRENGITALMVAGDLPAVRELKKLKFLVQLNMFKTGLSEFANIIFPVTSFLENEGHTITIGGHLKKVKKTVSGPEGMKTIPWIISRLAEAMLETGFSGVKSTDILKELQAFAGIPNRGSKKAIPKYIQVKPKPGKDNKEFPVNLMLGHNHFRYRGNSLTALIADLKKVINENVLDLSPVLLNQYNLKEGDRVKIITEYGESASVVTSRRELNGNSARLIPNCTDIFLLTGRISPDRTVINARIEKI